MHRWRKLVSNYRASTAALTQWLLKNSSSTPNGRTNGLPKKTSRLKREPWPPRSAPKSLRALPVCGRPTIRSSPGKSCANLHSLRGAIASIGFSACACHLLALEKNWAEMTEADRSRELRAALETFNAGLAQLTTRYPYLNGA